ncbi:MAG TPA: hypothetical protein VGF59_06635 [Bryobacteraceae bacterium]|jgi:hypothetical protein
MELRYMGFEQRQNARAYRFDGIKKGGPVRHFVVTVDLALFLAHHVGIQEGPTLCARKLAAELETCGDGEHALTEADLEAYASARAAADIRRAESRRAANARRAAAAGADHSPWRNSGL